MKTVSKIAKGSLKSNKSKSILIIITIILTTTLLTSVGITALNWLDSNKQQSIERVGSHHAIYKRADGNDIKIIENNIDIESFGLSKSLGSYEYKETILTLMYIDENAAKFNNVKFIEGNLPVKKNEIAIEDEQLKLFGIQPKVGEVIKIEYESRLTNEIKEKEFIISGIMETPEMAKVAKRYTSIVSKEFLEAEEYEEGMEFNTYVRVNGEDKLSGSDIKFKAESVAGDVGLNEYEVIINEDFINAMNPDTAVVGGAFAIVIIIVFSSMLVIYSIFYVSIITKVQEYGKLRAIGATKKQIKGIVLREGMVLASIAIPIGIAFGYFIANGVVKKLLLMDQFDIGGFNLEIMVSVLLVSYLTVFISLLKPMKIASKVSPIEAIRYNGDDNKAKNRKGYSEINIKKLTYANISRNKKRTVITLLSLGLSGILFITMSTVLNSMSAEELATRHMVGDFELALDNFTLIDDEVQETDANILKEKGVFGKEIQEEILNIDGVKEIIANESTSFYRELPSSELEYGNVQWFDKEYIKELEENLIEGEINYESLKNGNGIIYTYPQYAEKSGIKIGEKVKLTIFDGRRTFEKEFVVEAMCYVDSSEFIVPKNVYDEIITTESTGSIDVMVDKNKIEAVEESLQIIADGNDFIKLKTISGEIEVYEKSLKLTKTLAYSLVLIIGVIGFMNLINTMITSIITRKRELGMLQAIGMSNKQLVKMLQIEGMFYTIGTLLITLTLGNIVGYIAFLAFKNSGASYAVYSYPLIQTIIMIISITVAQLILTYLISNNFNKQSLVDRVRYSE